MKQIQKQINESRPFLQQVNQEYNERESVHEQQDDLYLNILLDEAKCGNEELQN